MAQDGRFIPIILFFFLIFSCTLFPFRIPFQNRIKFGHQPCFHHVKSQPVLLLKHKRGMYEYMLNYMPFSTHVKSKHGKIICSLCYVNTHLIPCNKKYLFGQSIQLQKRGKRNKRNEGIDKKIQAGD